MRLILPAILTAALTPAKAFAFAIPQGWAGTVCAFVPCTAGGGGAAGLSAYLIGKIVLAMEIGFIAVAIIMLFFSAVNMVMFAEQEDMVKQGRTQFIYAIAASITVSLARWIVTAFSPQLGPALVDQNIVNAGVGNIITFMKLGLTIMISVTIVIQGMRLVNSRGDQEQIDKARKRLISAFIGAAFVMLANIIVVGLLPGSAGSMSLANEIAGVCNYLITIIGFGCVVVLIAAGAALVLSVNDSLRDKAKTMVKVVVMILVALLISYALINTFVSIPVR